MMATKSYYIKAHFAESFKSLDILRKNKETCDIRLLASNKEIMAHRLVLASASKYFKSVIYGLFRKTELELNVQYEILCALVNFMYTGKIDINSKNVYDIYNAADIYLMNLLKDACLDFMEKILDLDNSVKIWIIANNCEHEKLLTAAENFIFSKMEIVSYNKEFLNLSNEQILDFCKRWPKHELFDSIITSLLKWAANKENWEETILEILKDIPHTNISEEYLKNFLTKNELIENSNGGNKWLLNIATEKLISGKQHTKSELTDSEAELKLTRFPSGQLTDSEAELKLTRFPSGQLTDSEAKLEFTRFPSDQPIIFMTFHSIGSHKFYKYNRHDGAFGLYNTKKMMNCSAVDLIQYKNWIYVMGKDCCERFMYDDLNENGYESAFQHKHDIHYRTAILNDSMYIFGGESSKDKGSSIDLNTKQTTRFGLLYDRILAAAVESGGSIYICGGFHTDIIERFDPREGVTTEFGKILFNEPNSCYDAGALSNQIYFCNIESEYQMMDLRNNRTCIQIEPPSSIGYGKGLVSSYGKMYTHMNCTIYQYIEATAKWQNHGSFPELDNAYRAISFK